MTLVSDKNGLWEIQALRGAKGMKVKPAVIDTSRTPSPHGEFYVDNPSIYKMRTCFVLGNFALKKWGIEKGLLLVIA